MQVSNKITKIKRQRPLKSEWSKGEHSHRTPKPNYRKGQQKRNLELELEYA